MMMKPLLPLLLTAVLLCGCAAQNPAAETEATISVPAPVSAPVQEDPIWEEHHIDGAVTSYSGNADLHGILSLGDNLLLFSGNEATTLYLVDPQTMQPLAHFETGFPLSCKNATVQLLESGLSYFDSTAGQTVVLDNSLREIRRITAPEDMTGMPLLSRDSRTLYYCTASAIRALDLSSGISRILKEAAYPVQGISGILLDDTLLQVSITETGGTRTTLFLSSQTGQLIHSADGNVLPQTSGNQFFLQNAALNCFYGDTEGNTMVLTPLHGDLGCWYLPDSHQAVSAGLTENSTALECYDLNTGCRTAQQRLDGHLFPEQMTQTADGRIWLLASSEQDSHLLCWDPAASAVQDETLYCSPRYTRSEPDYDGLSSCALYAQELSSKFGIDILVYKDAAAVEPWDYHLEYEHQANLLHRELEALDRRLSRFPEGFLQTLREKYTALNICIVRSIEGSPESGSPDAVNGIQFLHGFDAYIVLATDHNTEYALYHELSHLMETVVLTGSPVYDRWDNLNPSGFTYDNDYTANQIRDGSAWLEPGKEYFIDTYSMSFAKEDRARLFEYAMTPGHETLFSSPRLQVKLQKMSIAIREAFRMENIPEPLPWEQYLSEPLP